MASEDVNGFPKMLQLALREGNIIYSLELVTDKQYAEHVKNDSWDLIPLVTEYLTEENKCNKNELYKCCTALLNIISDISNPEEALLQIISEIEESEEDAKFLMLLQPLQKLINRIPTKKINSLAWSLNSIQTYIRQLGLPNYSNLEYKERLLVDNGDVIAKIVALYNEVILFYSYFINQMTKGIDREIKLVFCKFLIQLLGEPLGYLSTHMIGDVKSEGRLIADNIIHKVFQLVSDPFIFSEMILVKKQDELIKPDSKSVAHFFYLIFSEKMCIENVPKIYSPIYLFHTSLNLGTALLNDNNLIIVEKALNLCKDIFTGLKGQMFSYQLLDYTYHSTFCNLLSKVMIYNQSEIIRKRALLIFENYLNLFEYRGIYLIILNLTSLLTHGGLIGFMITFYKNLVYNQFTINENNMNDYFKGPKLFNLLRKFCLLKEKEETNLIDISDQIISCLNLLRYLALRDKNNVTKIWDFFPTLNDIYFTPLRKGIQLSKAHYELEIKNTNEIKLTENTTDKNKSISVTVSETNLQKIGKTEKLEILNSSLTVFDVLDSLLSRVMEVIDVKM